jgi:hypothetical protein
MWNMSLSDKPSPTLVRKSNIWKGNRKVHVYVFIILSIFLVCVIGVGLKQGHVFHHQLGVGWGWCFGIWHNCTLYKQMDFAHSLKFARVIDKVILQGYIILISTFRGGFRGHCTHLIFEIDREIWKTSLILTLHFTVQCQGPPLTPDPGSALDIVLVCWSWRIHDDEGFIRVSASASFYLMPEWHSTFIGC